MEQMDFKVSNGAREDFDKYAERLVKYANVLFVQLRSPAYIGKAW